MKKARLAAAFFFSALISCKVWAQAAAAPQSKSASPSPPVPVLVDDKGKTVGRFVGGGFFGAALLPHKNKSLVIRLAANPDATRGGLIWESGFLYYASDNCTGKAFLYSVAASGSRNPIQVMKEGDRYIAYIGRREAQIPSNLRSGRNGSTGACFTNNYGQPAVTPVESTVNLNFYGTPPFYIE